MRKLKLGNLGHLRMETIKELVRLYEQNVSNVAISKILGISRTSVVEYIKRINNNNVKYESIKDLSESEVVKLLGIRKCGAKGKSYEIDFEYVKKELLKPSVTKQLLWEEYLAKYSNDFYGYSHFCTQIANYEKSKDIWMHQEHKAGEEAQIDFAGDSVAIYNKEDDKVLFRANIFVGCLPASKLTTALATTDQTTNSWVLGIIDMFEQFGGVTSCIKSDNAKSIISEANFYEAKVNRVLEDLSQHYSTAIIPARVYKPKDKACVENAVGNVQRLLARFRNTKFYSLGELQLELNILIKELNNRTMKGYQKSRLELFNEVEKSYLKPLPTYRYKLTQFNTVRVKTNYHVLVENNFYSVPYTYREQIVETRVFDGFVEIYHRNLKIASHKLILSHNQYSTIKEHMPSQHKFMDDWNPEKFLAKAKEIGVSTLEVIDRIFKVKQHPKLAYKASLGILGLTKTYGCDDLEQSCLIAIQHNCSDFKSIKRIITNLDLYSNHNNTQDSTVIIHKNLRDSKNYC
jgi:transposase